MSWIRHLPIFIRIPLALACHGAIGFGPIVAAYYFILDAVPMGFILVLAVTWLIVFSRFLLWRIDCFWNVRSDQNRTGKPAFPDNHRQFKTLKGWLGWIFLGRDYEKK